VSLPNQWFEDIGLYSIEKVNGDGLPYQRLEKLADKM